MRSRDSIAARAAASLVLALGLGACAGVPAPNDWSANAKESQRDTRGAWVSIEYLVHGQKKATAWGEMIAAHADTLFVATAYGLRAFSWSRVTRGSVVKYDPEAGPIAAITLLGTVATISNGAFLVFTTPAWLIVGATASHARSRDAVLDLPPSEEDAARIAMYARFPQGLGPGIDRSLLVPSGARATRQGEVTRPAPGVALNSYAPRDEVGGGFVAMFGPHTEGSWLWSVGAHPRVYQELFVTGAYSQTTGELVTLDQWSVGLRVGRRYFVNARYIRSSSGDHSANGWGACGGVLTAPRSGLSLGLTVGVDVPKMDGNYYGSGPKDLGWIALTMQFTPSAWK